jgi:hypothetical protein
MSVVPIKRLLDALSQCVLFDIVGNVLRVVGRKPDSLEEIIRTYVGMMDDQLFTPLTSFMPLSFVKYQLKTNKRFKALSSETYKSQGKAVDSIKSYCASTLCIKLMNPYKYIGSYLFLSTSFEQTRQILSKWMFFIMLSYCITNEQYDWSFYLVADHFRRIIMKTDNVNLWKVYRHVLLYLEYTMTRSNLPSMHIVAPKITYDDIPLWRAKAYEQLNTLQQHTSFPQFNIGPLNILGDDYIDGVILNSVALDQPVLISCPTSAHYTPGNRLRLDHYYRQYGYYSSAHYKVVEILIREKIVPTQVMCLAEGSGSIAASFLKLYPSVRKLYYNSLHAPEEFTPHRITSYMPICLDDIDPSRLINLTASVVANNDLTKMYTVHDIIKQTEGFNMDVITCDAEYGAKGTIRMFLLIVAGALKICASKLISSGTLIYKTFSHDRVLLDTSLRMIRVLFSKVKVVYPLYASPN